MEPARVVGARMPDRKCSDDVNGRRTRPVGLGSHRSPPLVSSTGGYSHRSNTQRYQQTSAYCIGPIIRTTVIASGRRALDSLPVVRELRQTHWMQSSEISVRGAAPQDADFINEMARHAATLENRPLPARDDVDVQELLPTTVESAFVATAGSGRRLGAAWLLTDTVPLVPALSSAPELCMALEPDARNQGVGSALLSALLHHAAAQGHPTLVLNVHLRNTPALRLYMKSGFRVASAGRGWFGVAMSRSTKRE